MHSGILKSASLALLVLAYLPSTGNAGSNIRGGDDVDPNDPIAHSTIALYQQLPQGSALCTATLIARDMALTAAHCVGDDVAHLALIFGDNIDNENNRLMRVTHATIPEAWGQPHPDGKDLGDIALLKLEGTLPPGFHPVPLVPASIPLAAGQSVLLAGYGVDNARTHAGAGQLRQTTVEIAEPQFGNTEMVFDQSQGSGACHGDSGGPAFLMIGSRLHLLGVTNRGYPDGAPDDCRHEVVYTSVDAYRTWISEKMKEMRAQGD